MSVADQVGHLVARFWTSLRGAAPTPADEAWATEFLTEEALVLWRRQPAIDRRHSVAVARYVLGREPDAPGWVIEAALLHDVGKTDAGLGVAGRVVATMLSACGLSRAPGALGRHLRYPATGAAMLADAGLAPPVVEWAAQHHERPERWTVPAPWAARLAEADHRAG